MSTGDIWFLVAILWVLVMVLAGALFYQGLGLKRWRNTALSSSDDLLALRSRVRRAIESYGDRYTIEVNDWGPTFTGLDGTLPRYRWVVSEADFALRDLPDMPTIREKIHYMVGNAATKQQAFLDAATWIEQHLNPAILVEGNRVQNYPGMHLPTTEQQDAAR